VYNALRTRYISAISRKLGKPGCNAGYKDNPVQLFLSSTAILKTPSATSLHLSIMARLASQRAAYNSKHIYLLSRGHLPVGASRAVLSTDVSLLP
jgi:hypothetical protein